MSGSGDDVGDMGMTVLNDEAIEAFFLGESHPAWEQDAALSSLTDGALMIAAGPPPRPGPALAAFLGRTSAVEAPTVVAATPAATPTKPWQPRTVTTTTKRDNVVPLFRRLRLAARITVGAGVAAAALTVASTAGALPNPALRAVSWVVEAVTPFELHGPAPTVPASKAPPPATTSTVSPAPASGLGRDGQIVTPGQPAVNTPAGPSASVPAGVTGPGQPPATGLDRAGQTPGAPFIPPSVPAAPTPTLPPAAIDHTTTPITGVGRATQTPGGSLVPSATGSSVGRR